MLAKPRPGSIEPCLPETENTAGGADSFDTRIYVGRVIRDLRRFPREPCEEAQSPTFGNIGDLQAKTLPTNNSSTEEGRRLPRFAKAFYPKKLAHVPPAKISRLATCIFFSRRRLTVEDHLELTNDCRTLMVHVKTLISSTRLDNASQICRKIKISAIPHPAIC
jgi:hypothetical protein